MYSPSLNHIIASIDDNPYPVLEISEAVLYHNFNLVKKITGFKSKILIPVKANAYGCGIAELMPFFKTAQPDFLGVASPFEAHLVRKFGWNGKILNLGGFYESMAHYFTEYNITPSITDLFQIEILNHLARQKNTVLKVHIKLDFGMGRIGILIDGIKNVIEKLKTAVNLKVTGIFTHFPSSDNVMAESNIKIITRFNEYSGLIIEELKLSRSEVILHAANSYAIMLNPQSHLDMVRPGLSFYGYFSTEEDREKLSPEFPFKPVLSLKARPISIRKLPAGFSVSYGETCKVSEKEQSVGVIPLGYADGIPRLLSNKISFQGHPLLGRVTMDQIVVGGLTQLKDTLILLGEGSYPLERWADISGTISYEILVRLGERIQRKLVSGK